jgi:hypothetical protein
MTTLDTDSTYSSINSTYAYIFTVVGDWSNLMMNSSKMHILEHLTSYEKKHYYPGWGCVCHLQSHIEHWVCLTQRWIKARRNKLQVALKVPSLYYFNTIYLLLRFSTTFNIWNEALTSLYVNGLDMSLYHEKKRVLYIKGFLTQCIPTFFIFSYMMTITIHMLTPLELGNCINGLKLFSFGDKEML